MKKKLFYLMILMVVIWGAWGWSEWSVGFDRPARASGDSLVCEGSLTVFNTGDVYRVRCVDGPHKLTLISGADEPLATAGSTAYPGPDDPWETPYP